MLKDKEQKYEELLKAMSEGEFGMTKYLWDLLQRLEDNADIPGAKIEKFQKTIDTFIATFKDRKDGKDGKDGAPGKPGVDGKDGRPGRDGSDGRDGIDGFDGKEGKRGPVGHTPQHEWDGTKIRFQTEEGEWGEWVDLRGPIGPAGQAYGPADMPGGGMSGLYTIRGDGFRREGVTELYFGDNLTLTRTGNGVRVDAEAGGGGGGGGLDFETPTGDIDDTNVSFTVTETPLYLVVNGAQYFEGVHYTLATLVVTLFNPVGTGGFIRSAFGTGITVETPVGTVDDTNTTFTVTNEPKYIVVNGAQYFDGAGYTYTPGQIDLTSPIGDNGFIRSVY